MIISIQDKCHRFLLTNKYNFFNFSISPWLCKKGDYWVVWILNSHEHDISTTLIPSFSAESVIHNGDLIWDTCQTRLG